jgi:hypothetical protein
MTASDRRCKRMKSTVLSQVEQFLLNHESHRMVHDDKEDIMGTDVEEYDRIRLDERLSKTTWSWSPGIWLSGMECGHAEK